jgi:hypothetical protein
VRAESAQTQEAGGSTIGGTSLGEKTAARGTVDTTQRIILLLGGGKDSSERQTLSVAGSIEGT